MYPIELFFDVLELVFCEIYNCLYKGQKTDSTKTLTLHRYDFAMLGSCIWRMIVSFYSGINFEPYELLLNFSNLNNDSINNDSISDWSLDIKSNKSLDSLKNFCKTIENVSIFKIKTSEFKKNIYFNDAKNVLGQRQSNNAIVLYFLIQLVILHIKLEIEPQKRLTTYNKLFKLKDEGIKAFFDDDKFDVETDEADASVNINIVSIERKLFEHLYQKDLKPNVKTIEAEMFNISGQAYQTAASYYFSHQKDNNEITDMKIKYIPGLVFYALIDAEIDKEPHSSLGGQMENYYVLLDKIVSSCAKRGS